MKSVDLIGWASSAILLATIVRQVYTQWKTKTIAGVSKYLFVGQLAASTGFTVYSLMLQNWVFLASNVALLITAVTGQILYFKNKKRTAAPNGAPQHRSPTGQS